MYNKTQLTPQHEFERHIYHRDQFAHYFRWSHVLKNAKIGQRILDFGCGSGEMLEVFYRNRFRPECYIGLDIRREQIIKNAEKFKNLNFAQFFCIDLCKPFSPLNEKFDIITCFEVIEHIGHANIDPFLTNLARNANSNTTIYISTPNFDPSIGAAKNHILDGEIGEWDHFELQNKLSKYFTIKHKYGTFASIKDYRDELTGWRLEMFNHLKNYYDTNLLSVLMAPVVSSEKARNCLWVCEVK